MTANSTPTTQSRVVGAAEKPCLTRTTLAVPNVRRTDMLSRR